MLWELGPNNKHMYDFCLSVVSVKLCKKLVSQEQSTTKSFGYIEKLHRL